jgi:hypothetical protein
LNVLAKLRMTSLAPQGFDAEVAQVVSTVSWSALMSTESSSRAASMVRPS